MIKSVQNLSLFFREKLSYLWGSPHHYQSTTEKCIQHKILNNDHIKQMVEELT